MDENDLEYITPSSWYALASKNRELTERVKVLTEALQSISEIVKPRQWYDDIGDTEMHWYYGSIDDKTIHELAKQALEQSAPDVDIDTA